MPQQQPSHAAVAAATILGAFGAIIAALVTGHDLPQWMIALVSGAIGNVVGFYFGNNAANSALTVAHTTLAHLTGLLTGRTQTPAAPAATAPAPDHKE